MSNVFIKHKKIFIGVIIFLMFLTAICIVNSKYVLINKHFYDCNTTSLDLSYRNLSLNDTKKLKRFKKLEHLNVLGTGVYDISFLNDLSGLKTLNVGSRGVSIKDWTPLQSCTQLEYFTGWDSDFEDLSFLSSLKNLKILDLYYGNNDLKNIDDIVYLDNLEEIYVVSSGVTDISYFTLEKFKKMKKICIIEGILTDDEIKSLNSVGVEVQVVKVKKIIDSIFEH